MNIRVKLVNGREFGVRGVHDCTFGEPNSTYLKIILNTDEATSTKKPFVFDWNQIEYIRLEPTKDKEEE